MAVGNNHQRMDLRPQQNKDTIGKIGRFIKRNVPQLVAGAVVGSLIQRAGASSVGLRGSSVESRRLEGSIDLYNVTDKTAVCSDLANQIDGVPNDGSAFCQSGVDEVKRALNVSTFSQQIPVPGAEFFCGTDSATTQINPLLEQMTSQGCFSGDVPRVGCAVEVNGVLTQNGVGYSHQVNGSDTTYFLTTTGNLNGLNFSSLVNSNSSQPVLMDPNNGLVGIFNPEGTLQDVYGNDINYPVTAKMDGEKLVIDNAEACSGFKAANLSLIHI